MARTTELGYVATPTADAGPAVLVIHSWWGLTSSFTAYADQLAGRGFVVGCADLYGGRIARTEAEVARLRSARRSEPMYVTLTAAIDQLQEASRDPRAPVGVIGFSMGGHWACWLTQHLETVVSATVLYYAARSGDFSRSTAPILAHFAGNDAFVSTAARRRMERAIGRSARRYMAYDYAGAHHWFAERAHPAYDGNAAELAFERTVALLSRVSAAR